MDSMTNSRGVVVGVDAHTDTHDVAVLDDCGRLLARQTFAADAAGYRALREWIEPFAPIAAIGVESTGSYAAGLVRHMRAEGLEVVLEINQPHPHTRRRRGKSDPIDAELAARHVLAANRPVVAKDTSGIVEAIRQLRVARDGAVKARTAALNALNGLIITAPEDLRRQLTARKTKRARAKLCERLRPDPQRLREPEQAAKAALRSLARRITELDGEIELLDQQLAQLVAEAAPSTINRVAVGAGHAATLLVTAGQTSTSAPRGRVRRAVRRQPDSHLQRAHRPSPPQLRRRPRRHSRALHLIAVCRLRCCERTRAYAARRTAEGKTKTEIIRCLKRYIAREIYHALVADLLAQPGTLGPRAPIMSVTCGAGPIGHTIRS